jgi:hypothetical protein
METNDYDRINANDYNDAKDNFYSNQELNPERGTEIEQPNPSIAIPDIPPEMPPR